jgi:hypothetical protein
VEEGHIGTAKVYCPKNTRMDYSLLNEVHLENVILIVPGLTGANIAHEAPTKLNDKWPT